MLATPNGSLIALLRMIYEVLRPEAEIRQGDVFRNVPRIDISLEAIQAFDASDGIVEKQWGRLVQDGGSIEAVLPITPVTAIVVSQDCDASRAEDLSLCEVRRFTEVYPPAGDAKKASTWVKLITEHARRNPKWFYLPPMPGVFEDRMAVDFFAMFRLARTDLEAYREHRIGSLVDPARTHFRERISEFFRRYPYDEWYPLSAEEFGAYREKYEDASPFPWQT